MSIALVLAAVLPLLTSATAASLTPPVRTPAADPAPPATAGRADEHADAEAVLETRLSAADLSTRLAALAAEHPGLCRLVTLGESTGGVPVQGLAIASGAPVPGGRTGLLITGDFDGRRVADAAIVLDVAAQLLARDDLDAALGERAIIVIPRPNPDGAEALLGMAGPAHEQTGNGRPDDADHDGRIDEDGPNDLDGDGVITLMRVPDPEGEWLIDEHDGRALRKARRERGERGTHRVYVEGTDDDGDGAFNEDGSDGVHPDANFPHDWDDVPAEAGEYPLSEPESATIARVLLENPGLTPLVIGAQDTLVSLPSKAKTVRRGGFGNRYREPLDGVLGDDHATLEELKRRFGEAGEDDAPEHDVKGPSLSSGSFLAWVYHQAGRWPLAVRPWAPPEKLPAPEKKDDAEPAGDDDAPDAANGHDDDANDEHEHTNDADHEDGHDGDADDEHDDDAAGEHEHDADGAQADEGRDEGGRRRGGKRRGGSSDDSSADDSEDSSSEKPGSDKDSPVPAAVLAWLDDDQDGAGAVPWQPFDHPDLGSVEIGGLAPGVLVNAPGDAAARVSTRLAAFTLDLLAALPVIAFESVEVSSPVDGIYELKAALVNTGVLPTGPQFAAEARLARAIRVGLRLPEGAAILNGPTQVLVDRLAGGGGRREMRWLIAASSGQQIVLEADADTVDGVEREVPLP